MFSGWKSIVLLGAILLGTYDHSMTPCDWFANWYGFKCTQSRISVGVACGSIISLIGGPSMSRRVWCSHVLKMLEL